MSDPIFWLRDPLKRYNAAILEYLNGVPMSDRDIQRMREYLEQFIAARAWCGDGVIQLRKDVRKIRTRVDIRNWLNLAEAWGIDPL